MLLERDPEREAVRLASIARYEILDSPREQTFDRIVAIASTALGTAMSAITLVDAERSWHKAEVGMGVDEMPRADEMCDRTLSQDSVLIINDALEAPRELVLPMLKFGIRFYAGAPLRTYTGVKIGTICVMDPEPRVMTPGHEQILRDLASIVIDEFELRLAARTMNETDAELRRLNQRLEATNRNKSEFLASMSHELRTPLNGILGASELLLDQLFGELNPKQREYVADVQACGMHLLRLIEDLLDLSRIEAGQMALHPDTIDVSLLMSRCVAVVRGLATARSMAIAVTPPVTPVVLHVDERRIIQIVCNLLSNALKFSPSGTEVRFSARVDGTTAVFTVEDNGPGIPADLQDRIFEQFFRAASDQEGTGLGLPLARQLVELHGGRIWLDSVRGEGSRFSFTVPLPTGGQS